MTEAQLYLAVGLPTLAVLAGILTNAVLFQSLSARVQNLDTKFDTRFDPLMSKIIDVDNRLTRVEERLEHRP